MTQLEFLKQAVDLAEKNPDHEIHFCVNSEEVLEDGWTGHKIKKVELGYWWFDGGERIYVDLEEIAEEMSDIEEKDISEEEAEQNPDVKKAILIYTDAG